MATKNIVPRANNEGGIGTSAKRWANGYFTDINASGDLSVTGTITGDLTGNVTGDVTGTASGNLPLTGGTLTGAVNGVTPLAGDDSKKLATTEYVQEEIRQHGNLPVGYEYFQMNPNIPQGSLPMLGGVYSRETYADLWDWVQTQTGYLITDSAWQALSNTQNGNVPFYSSGDGSTTFRVPSLKCWIKGTDGTETVGTYLDAGLPNITGDIMRVVMSDNIIASATGVFSNSETVRNNRMNTSANYGSQSNIDFDASLSSPIYGNADTVVPESIAGMWLVKAYGTVVDTGTIDEKAYMDEQFAINVPTGCVQAFAGQTTPTGWLLCDGSAVSRVTYAKLFSVIGTSYGSGDGTDTFNLPNLVDKFIQGNAVAGTEHSAGLPNIEGAFGYSVSPTAKAAYISGAISHDGGTAIARAHDTTSAADKYTTGITFNASNSNSIYGNSTTVQPPAVTMRYIIKY